MTPASYGACSRPARAAYHIAETELGVPVKGLDRAMAEAALETAEWDLTPWPRTQVVPAREPLGADRDRARAHHRPPRRGWTIHPKARDRALARNLVGIGDRAFDRL